MKPTDRLKRARIGLILDEPFFGSLLMQLKPIEDATVKTFCTNGQWLRWNPDYLATRSDIQVKTICCEEVMHCAFLHFLRRGDRDPGRWNEACDYAIYSVLNRYNQQVASSGRTPPFEIGDGLFHPRFDGMAAEEIYSLLQSERSQDLTGASGGSGDQPGQPQCSQLPPVQSPGEFVDGGADQAQLQEQEANWKVALQQAAEAAKQQGKLPAEIARLVQEMVDPAVPWREVLRDFITAQSNDDYSWARPNRRFSGTGFQPVSGGRQAGRLSHYGRVILPSLYSRRLGPIAVAIDTSGSIGQKELDIFLSELRSILFDCRPEKLILMQCDAAVQEYREMEPFDDIELKLKGGGGTDFRPVFAVLDGSASVSPTSRSTVGDAAADAARTAALPPACLIYLTDLQGTFPEHAPAYPVLWAATEDGEAPFGTTLRIKP